jgi:LuxR family transcriptional regulator, maltose regulon positive regulatory protein
MRKRPYRRRTSTSADPAAELLSRREIDVLRLLAMGRSNPEIASLLVIAESTVKMHIKHLYDKLGVHNRVEAAVQAQALRLLA